MKRRTFFGTSAGAAALISGAGGCADTQEKPSTASSAADKIGSIGDYTIEQVLNRYEYYLFDDFIPFHDKYVIDLDYGCYYSNTDHDGSHANTNTSSSFMGRGIWCYSFLYNNLDKNDRYLDIAAKGVQFIMKHQPSGDNHWPGAYTREGNVVGDRKGPWHGDCYISEGLAEYGRATGETKYMDIGRETIFKCAKLYDKPDFDSGMAYSGSRNLWYWMLLMWFGTCWLQHKQDTELKALVDRCMDAIMNHHTNPKFNLMNNTINHDLTTSDDPKHSELAGCGHATEATWMIMYEAIRRKDKALFDRISGMFKRHAIVSKDDVYGGYFNDCINVDENTWQLSKISWAQAFILINSLYAVEHSGWQWAKDIFSDQFTWCQEKLPLKKHGFALWLEARDRFATFIPKASRKDNYHHPRHLMLNVASARRMSKRGGKVSDVFS